MEKRNKTGQNSFLLIKFRVPLLVLFLTVSLLAGFGIRKLDITTDMDQFFLEEDPVLQNQKEFSELFGNNDFIGVLVESDDVFSKDSLELIFKIGVDLQQKVSFSGTVRSIATAGAMIPGYQGLEFNDKGVLLSSREEREEIQEIFQGTPSISDRLFSSDKTQAWVLLSLENYPLDKDWEGKESPQFTVGKQAWDCIQTIKTGSNRVTATGVPVYAYRKQVEMMGDLIRILISGFIIAILISAVIIRNFRGLMGTLSVILVSIISVLGIQGHLGTSIDSSFLAVPLLLSTGVSIGYTVHISRFFTLKLNEGGKRTEAVQYALDQCRRPLLFTAFTTIVALFSFVFVKIRPIRWVGITSAVSILAVVAVSLTLFPVILSFGKDSIRKYRPGSKKDWKEKLMERFVPVINKKPRFLIILFIAAACLFGVGISRVKVDFNAEKMMGTRLQHMKDQIHVGKSSIAVSDSLDLVLHFEKNALKDPLLLAKIAEMEKEIDTFPLVKRSTSLNNLVRSFNYLKHKRDPAYDKVPDKASSLRGLYQFFSRIEPEGLRSWVDEDFSSTRIFIELSDFSSKEIVSYIKEIEELSERILPEASDIYFSGSTYQMALMNQYVTKGLVSSFLISLFLITCIMTVLFRSFRIGLIAMIPNVFPVLAAGALMGFMKIPLEFVTMTIAPMIMGLAVDDTIHLIYHLKKAMKEERDYSLAVSKIFRHVGSAITETTIIICITFLVFTFSKINSIIHMGIISSLAMLTAYICDIFLTPILIKYVNKSRRNKLS